LPEGHGHCVYDGTDVVLDFFDDDAGGPNGEQLARRYLWGPAVDQLLAQEAAGGGGAEDVLWPLTDHLGTVRDLARYDDDLDQTSVVTHYTFDSFGNATATLGNLTDTRYLFTSQEYDPATALYYYDARWYDPATGTFVLRRLAATDGEKA
jgi:RHS repeat-associated protein